MHGRQSIPKGQIVEGVVHRRSAPVGTLCPTMPGTTTTTTTTTMSSRGRRSVMSTNAIVSMLTCTSVSTTASSTMSSASTSAARPASSVSASSVPTQRQSDEQGAMYPIFPVPPGKKVKAGSSKRGKGTRSSTGAKTTSHVSSPPSKKSKMCKEKSAGAELGMFSTRQHQSRGGDDPTSEGKISTLRSCTRRLFQGGPTEPHRTTCTVVSGSTTVTSTPATSSTGIVTPSCFYGGAGRQFPLQAVTTSSHNIAFRQPKREVYELQHEIAGSVTTTRSSSSASRPSSISLEQESHRFQSQSSSHGEEGSASVSPIAGISVGDICLSPNIRAVAFRLEREESHHDSDLEDDAVEESSRQPSHESWQSVILSSPESSPPSSLGTLREKSPPIAPVILAKAGRQASSVESATPANIILDESKPEAVAGVGRTRTSELWNHFVGQTDRRVATCNYCGKQVSRGQEKAHLTNSGMKQHLQTHHKAVLLRQEGGVPAPSSNRQTSSSGCAASTTAGSVDSVIPPPNPKPVRQASLQQFGGFQSVVMSKQQSCKITRLIGELIAVGGAPFNMVEVESFKRLMEAVAPQYHIPSRTTFSRRVVPSLYRSCVSLLKEELAKAVGQSVHLTTDLWSAPSGQHAFLSLTAHWWQPSNVSEVAGSSRAGSSGTGAIALGGKHGYRNFLLHTEVMDEQHTAANILQALRRMVSKWPGLQTGFVVTDGAANMVKAVRDGGFVGVRCAAHTLHLVVTAAMQQNSGSLVALLDSCRRIAGHFHRSVKASQLLREEQKRAGLPEHRLKQDVCTRWNSTMEMLERLLEQQKAIHAMAVAHSIGISSTLGSRDWLLMGQVVAILMPFRDATENLSHETAHLALVIPLFRNLLRKLDGFLTDGEAFPVGYILDDAAALVRSLNEHLATRFAKVMDRCPQLMLASMCDPRLKGKVALGQDSLTFWRDKLTDRVRDLQRKRGMLVDEVEDLEEPVEATQGSGSSRAPFSCVAEAYYYAVPTDKVQRKESSAAEMVKGYLRQPIERFSTDPLTFWHERRDVWPALSLVAQELLSCPPTSVQSERVFSVTGNILSPQRSMLSPQLMEQLAFLKCNLPKLGYPTLSIDTE